MPNNIALDINECLDTPCSHNAQCQNTFGSFICKCEDGFYGNGFKCYDLENDQCGKRSVADAQFNQVDSIPFLSKRIVGGQDATLRDWPWMANIRYRRGWFRPFCGASILSDQFLLTAAHCQVSTAHRIYVGDWHIYPKRKERTYKVLIVYLMKFIS